MELLSLHNLAFRYPGADVPIFQNFELSLLREEVLAVVGPSGCGKTTLLRLVASLLQPEEGKILLEGEAVEGPGRDRGVLFQGDTCFKWLTVRKNIEFAVKKRSNRSRTDELLRIAHLEDVANAYPKSLSFGMRQRVSLMRTIAAGAKVMLLDEPLSAVDALTALELQVELRDLLAETHSGALWVTHDLEEAITVGTRVVILGGRPVRIVSEYTPKVVVRSVEDRLTGEFTQEYTEFLGKAFNTWSM